MIGLPQEFLDRSGIDINANGNLFHLTSATQKWMKKQEGSKEYNTLATKALFDTINHWVKANQPTTGLLEKMIVYSTFLEKKLQMGSVKARHNQLWPGYYAGPVLY